MVDLLELVFLKSQARWREIWELNRDERHRRMLLVKQPCNTSAKDVELWLKKAWCATGDPQFLITIKVMKAHRLDQCGIQQAIKQGTVDPNCSAKHMEMLLVQRLADTVRGAARRTAAELDIDANTFEAAEEWVRKDYTSWLKAKGREAPIIK